MEDNETLLTKLEREKIELQKEKEQLQHANEVLRRLASAVDQSADNVVITDRNGIIEYVNPAFEKLTGFTKDEVIGKTPRILKSGKYDQKYYKNLWQTILSGKSFRFQFINRKKNGELYYTEETITPIKDIAGNITHFVSTGKDITQNKLAEEAL
ncbi:MAG TPA: PAS domain S-box protein, partial [Acidobacteriota bacterium]